MKTVITTVMFFIGALIGYLIHPDPKPEPAIKGYVTSYQATITNNMTKIGNIMLPSSMFTELNLNQVLNSINQDTNIVKGSVVILNAIPVY